MKTRIITGLVLIAVILPCVILGGAFYKYLLVFITGGAVFEMLSICDRPKAPIYLYPIVGIFMYYCVFFDNNLIISNIPIMIYLIVLLGCSMFDNHMDFLRLCYYFLAGVMISMGLHMIYELRIHYGFEYLLLMAIATFATDTGAYFVGMKFGKHKLNPRLSPKKTIEGSLGGILLGTVLSVCYGSYIHIGIPIIYLIGICLILTITGQVGDLTFSSIKRTFEVKDYSQIFPGHGGILDRFDSLLFNSLVFGILLHILTWMVI